MLKNFIEIVGIADPSEFPILVPLVDQYTQYILQETVTIPVQKPDVEQIDIVLVEASVTNYNVIMTPVGLKIIVNGNVKQKVIYTALTEAGDQPVHSAEYDYPFSTFINVPLVTTPLLPNISAILASLGLTLDTVLAAPPQVLIEDMSVNLIDSRTIAKAPVLFIWSSLVSALTPFL